MILIKNLPLRALHNRVHRLHNKTGSSLKRGIEGDFLDLSKVVKSPPTPLYKEGRK